MHLHLLELNSELKCGSTSLVRIRKANYVSAKLLTDQLADIQAYPDAFGIQVPIGFKRDKRLEEFALVLVADPWAHVMHDHRQECFLAGGPIAVLFLLNEHGGAEGDLDRAARRTVHHGVREHVEEHLLVLGLIVEELGVG